MLLVAWRWTFNEKYHTRRVDKGQWKFVYYNDIKQIFVMNINEKILVCFISIIYKLWNKSLNFQ